MPDITDPAQIQAYFLQEVQLGEELLSEGDVEGAVEHLSTAILLCGQPQQLLQILRQTLPPQVFTMLLAKLPVKRPAGATTGAGEETNDSGVTVTEILEDQELE